MRAALGCDALTNVEPRDHRRVEHAIWDDWKQLGEFPMRIMSNDYGKDAPPGDEETNVRDQRGWLTLSPNSRQAIVTTGHDVVWDETKLTH